MSRARAATPERGCGRAANQAQQILLEAAGTKVQGRRQRAVQRRPRLPPVDGPAQTVQGGVAHPVRAALVAKAVAPASGPRRPANTVQRPDHRAGAGEDQHSCPTQKGPLRSGLHVVADHGARQPGGKCQLRLGGRLGLAVARQRQTAGGQLNRRRVQIDADLPQQVRQHLAPARLIKGAAARTMDAPHHLSRSVDQRQRSFAAAAVHRQNPFAAHRSKLKRALPGIAV